MAAQIQDAIQAVADRVEALAPSASDADALVRLGKAVEGLIHADAVGAVETARDAAVQALDTGRVTALADLADAAASALATLAANAGADAQLIHATLIR